LQIKVNDKTLAEHAIIQDDTSYIPVWAIANLVKVNIIWNEQTQSVRAGSHEVPGTVKGNVIYVSAQNLQQLFGGQVLVKAEDKVVEYNMYRLVLNNKVIAGEARMAGEVVAVPVLTVADSLGYKYIWDGANKTLLVQNKPIPIVMLDNQPYLPITQLYDCLQAYVFLNQQAYTIELTYPFTPQ
ncbi:stalk domain-containing protein, partial [Anaerospora hongkongensis]|uniref:stalk domain-containing protein n=1 Tax=Anaerospora hongkongensis TaxID=244830 RepID=UPI003A520C0E